MRTGCIAWILLLAMEGTCAAPPFESHFAPVQTGAGHLFVCPDYTQGKVFIVSAEGRVEWEYAAPNCNDL